MRKKIVSVLLIMCLCISMAAACTSKTSGGGTLTSVGNKLTIADTDITGNVENAVNEFKLSDYLTVSGSGFKIMVYTDEARTIEVADDTKIQLNEGDNTYYLKVSGSGSNKNYLLKIYRNKMFTVTFYIDADDTAAYSTQYVEEGKKANAPANPSNLGYEFTGWDKLVANTVITANTKFVASWDASATIMVKSAAGAVLAQGTEELTYNGTYNAGDVIEIVAPYFIRNLVVQLDEHMGLLSEDGESYEEHIVHTLDGRVSFTVPERPTASAEAFPYNDNAFMGDSHKITARIATAEEVSTSRNIAANPIDQRADVNSFPHAIATSTNPNLLENEARNAIDGTTDGATWQGTPSEATGITVLLGRTVSAEKVVITARDDAGDADLTTAALEFSDGTTETITFTDNVAEVEFQADKLISWAKLTDIGRVAGGQPALAEIEIFGYDSAILSLSDLDREVLVNQVREVNEYWMKSTTGGDTFWEHATYFNANMEAYFLTGDEDYYRHAYNWAERSNWEFTYGDKTIAKLSDPDNYHCIKTYIDLVNMDESITGEDSATGYKKFEVAEKLIYNIANNVTVTAGSDYSGKDGTYGNWMWTWCDLLYMGMPIYTKMFLRTGDEAYLDKMNEFFDHQSDTMGLYDKEAGLWYRDAKYIYSTGSLGKSPNGKKVFWGRGNGWSYGALVEVLRDLPDSNVNTQKYKDMFIEMSDALVDCQGASGFWSQNLADPMHVLGPDTSGTAFFLFGLAWGLNNGLIEGDKYVNALLKGYSAMNANAIHPNGYVGRTQQVGADPEPNLDFGYTQAENYSTGATILMLSELSKLVGGIGTPVIEQSNDAAYDFNPMLRNRMVGGAAVKVGSTHAIVGSNENIVSLNKAVYEKDGEVYVPADFINTTFNVTLTAEDSDCISLVTASSELGRKLFVQECTDGDVIVISYKEQLFRPASEKNLIDFMNKVLTNGSYPTRPASSHVDPTSSRFPNLYTAVSEGDYIEHVKVADGNNEFGEGDYILSTKAVTFTPFKEPAAKTDGKSTVEVTVTPRYDMVDGVIALGASNSSATAFGNIPIIVRMYTKGGTWQAWNGKAKAGAGAYVTSDIWYEKGQDYVVKFVVDFNNRSFDAFVTDAHGEITQIAKNYGFRGGINPSDVGKIYLSDGGWSNQGYFARNIKVNGAAMVPVTMPNMGNYKIHASTDFNDLSSDNVTADSFSDFNVTYNGISGTNTATRGIRGDSDYYFAVKRDTSGDPRATFGFTSITSGKIVLSVDVLPEATNNANIGMTSSDGKTVFTLMNLKDAFVIRSGAPGTGASNDANVGSYTANTWYSIIIEIDLTAQKYNIWINNIYRGTFNFRANNVITSVSSFYMGAGSTDATSINIDNLNVYVPNA